MYELWRRLAEYSAGEAGLALDELMAWIARQIGADNITWIAAVRVRRGPRAAEDPFFGWRLRARHSLSIHSKKYQEQLSVYYLPYHYGKLTAGYYLRAHDGMKEDHVGMTGRASMAGCGRFRVHRLRDGWIDFAAFQRTTHYKLYYQATGIVDRITIGFPLYADMESFFLIDRVQGEGTARKRQFSLAEATLAGNAVRGVPELHRRLFLGCGLLQGNKLLSPMERQILHGLLAGSSEKQIAASIGKKTATVHKYVTGLYARFGVKSRPALMAIWLGKKRPAPDQPPPV